MTLFPLLTESGRSRRGLGKGKQFVPHGRKVMMAFPGGAGYGDPNDRSRESLMEDLLLGYVSIDAAIEKYGLSAEDIAEIKARSSIRS